MYKYIVFVAACIGLLVSCIQEPTFDNVPFIRFESITKNVMLQSSPSFQDSTLTTIFFEDGDGDLGGDSLAVFIVDTRTGNVDTQFRITEIEVPGMNRAISGTISFPIASTCCIYDDGRIPCSPSLPVIEQEIVYEVFIQDRAGNESNRILLEPILLICE